MFPARVAHLASAFPLPFGAEPLAASRDPIQEGKSPAATLRLGSRAEAALRLGSRAEAVLSEVEFETLKIWV